MGGRATPGVLWAYRTTSQKPTEMSPFTLTYGIEAIIPTEIGMPTLRTEIPEKTITKVITKDLDMVDELRKAAAIRIASYQQRMMNLYNWHVSLRTFQTGDLVLGKVFENTTDPTIDKFKPN